MFGTHHSVMFSTKKLKIMGPTHWPNVIRLFSLFFFSPLTLIFLYLSSFSAFPLRFSLPLLFVFPLVILPNPFTNLATKIKVWICSTDLHRHLAPPTSWALSPNATRSPLSCRGGVDLWSWTWLTTRYSPSFSLPCRARHGWQQYSSFHCCAMLRFLLLLFFFFFFFFLGFWFGLIWDRSQWLWCLNLRSFASYIWEASDFSLGLTIFFLLFVFFSQNFQNLELN